MPRLVVDGVRASSCRGRSAWLVLSWTECVTRLVVDGVRASSCLAVDGVRGSSCRGRSAWLALPFKNRRRAKGWLPPSLISRLLNVYNWGKKLINLSPIACIEVETARFDTQKLILPYISGIKYQQGTLQGYDIPVYLIEKWKRICTQCDKTGVPTL